MPLIGILLGGIDLTTLTITIGSAVIAYGLFIQALINFLIIAFVVFLIVRTMNRMKKLQPVAPPEPPQDVILLGEIRDLLKK
jgi:large conductance mechanosensitive channel